MPDGIPDIVPQDLFERVQVKPDVRQKSHRKMLIDAFVSAIFPSDDKTAITFNCKEGTKTITFAELQEAIGSKRAHIRIALLHRKTTGLF